MNVLSYSSGIIMDLAINAPGHVKNGVDGINVTNKYYLKEEMEYILKLASNYTLKIGILPNVSKDFSIKFSDQCRHIPNNKHR